ncbi:YtpR family tRNA-binding protein, partial [Candidatus Latescibacterota bacterium]
MKVTYRWLKEYVDIDWEWPELVERLTMSGTEMETVDDLAARFQGVVVGGVLEVSPHPNADRLSVCRVDLGSAEESTIVCGAPNVAARQRVPVVLPGSQLPDGTAIRRTKIRGIESAGMICSEVELGLGDDSSGIMVLPEACQIGADFASQVGLDDAVIEFEVTPNRPDCLSVVGLAREVGALNGARLRLPEVSVAEAGEAAAASAGIDIEDPVGCPRYAGRVIRGVRVGPSPGWLRHRLLAIGQRPINNVVDATNFVMMELGQPLHAFDLQRLVEGRIVVRRARAGEHLETLDGE